MQNQQELDYWCSRQMIFLDCFVQTSFLSLMYYNLTKKKSKPAENNGDVNFMRCTPFSKYSPQLLQQYQQPAQETQEFR